MIDELLLHQRTKNQVLHFIANPSHALLLTGSDGIGKSCLAQSIIVAVLGITPAALKHYPYYSVISDANGTISIESIRSLRQFVQLRTVGNNRFRRAVLVEHAQCMTTEAQNAFLKLLEEPPADTLLVLTADSKYSLLPTIISRLQTITIYALNEQACKDFFETSGNKAAGIEQAYFLSGGLPGLMHALLAEDSSHPLLEAVAVAKDLLRKQQFDRLVAIDALSKQKDQAKYVVEALQHIAETGIKQATKKDDVAKLKQWHHVLKLASETHVALDHMANPKLALANLVLCI